MSSRVLSHAEFAATGGGSRRYTDGTEAPKSGYFVSRPGEPPAGHPSWIRGSEHEVKGRQATAVDVAHHWNATRADALGKTWNKSEVYQGLWHDSDSGNSYLDVSDRVHNLPEAVNRGIKSHQIAIYDANRGASVYLNPNGDREAPSATSTHFLQGTAQYRMAHNPETGRHEYI